LGLHEAESGRHYTRFVGIDIAAKTFTARWLQAQGRATRPLLWEQTAEGFATLRGRLLATGRGAGEILVVMEATGSYWMALATDLAQAGFAVSVINPKQAHDFASSDIHRPPSR
jgi:transposase